MKIYRICEIDGEDDATIENLKSVSNLKDLFPQFAEKAQEIYDKWDESDRDTYAGGGICHLIADGMSSIMGNNGIDSTTYSSDFEQHVYCIARVKEGIYSVDIHHSYYETGGGFSWKKIEDVDFFPEDVSLYLISSDINEWDNIVGEY